MAEPNWPMVFNFDNVIQFPAILIQRYPWLCFLPAAALLLFSGLRRKTPSNKTWQDKFVNAPVLLWFIYGLYECYISYYWVHIVTAPIRLDLLIAIFLFYLTLAMVFVSVLGSYLQRRKGI